MISRYNLSAGQSDNQLQEIEKQLKYKLYKAKQLSQNFSPPFFQPTKNIEIVETPQFDSIKDYSQQYWKTYLENEIQLNLIKDTQQKKQMLSELIVQIQNLEDQFYKINKMRMRKKNRRLASEIEKKFMCPYDKCQRIYGSDVSLNLHIKIKHNGGNKTDRQKMAEAICSAQEKILPPPQLVLDLPPGYLQQYRKLYFQKDMDEPIYTYSEPK